MMDMFICDHATHPLCPLGWCPHRVPHEYCGYYGHEDDKTGCGQAPCFDEGAEVFPAVRCVPVEA